MKNNDINKLVLKIINNFPKSKNGHAFLTLKNGRKLFFQIFLKKYGIISDKSKYKESDILRRVRLIEFFDYFVKDFVITRNEVRDEKKMLIIESEFYRMIILDIKNKRGVSKLELLSFYHYK